MPNSPQISLLKYIHSHHFIHHDIKLQNMLMSIEGSKDTIYLINFGIAKHYRHPSSCVHIPVSQRFQDGILTGTPAFTSVNSHLRFELSWRDDLESLVYTLLFLYTRSLPWLTPQGNQTRLSTSTICQAKETIIAEDSPGIPTELLALLSYSHHLSFMQKPNYDHLQSFLLPVATLLTFLTDETKIISGSLGALVQPIHTHDNNHKM